MNKMNFFLNISKPVLSIIVTLLLSCPLLAESTAEKAKKQKKQNIHAITFLEVPMANYGKPEQQKSYKSVKFTYGRAIAFFFEDDFRRAYGAFLGVQKDLEKIYEQFSIEYINRTELILQQALQTLVEINIKYRRESDVVKRMLRNIEPPNEKPYYQEKEFHFIYDKKTMTRNMDRAYYLLGNAKRLRKKAIDLIKNLEDEKPIPVRYRSKRVKDYRRVIELCRLATRNAIRVHQYINRNKLYQAEPSYRDNPTFFEKKVDPVFDTSVPQEYVIDLNDSYNRIHQTEIDYKVLLKGYDQKDK